MSRKLEWNTRYVKLIIFDVSTCCVRLVGQHCGDPMSLLLIRNITLNISPVPYATQFLDLRIVTTNTREKCTVISITAHGSLYDVMGVDALF
jgi:hypothetical protein